MDFKFGKVGLDVEYTEYAVSRPKGWSSSSALNVAKGEGQVSTQMIVNNSSSKNEQLWALTLSMKNQLYGWQTKCKMIWLIVQKGVHEVKVFIFMSTTTFQILQK